MAGTGYPICGMTAVAAPTYKSLGTRRVTQNDNPPEAVKMRKSKKYWAVLAAALVALPMLGTSDAAAFTCGSLGGMVNYP
jgi:hypothetical protein